MAVNQRCKMTSEKEHHQNDSFVPQSTSTQARDAQLASESAFLAHVVLYQPQIPQNTGNIGRTCVATQAKLWIVQPAAFQIDEKRVKRAGLDYWQHLHWTDVPSWQSLRDQLPERPNQRYWYLSRFAEKTIWDCDFLPGDVFVSARIVGGGNAKRCFVVGSAR